MNKKQLQALISAGVFSAALLSGAAYADDVPMNATTETPAATAPAPAPAKKKHKKKAEPKEVAKHSCAGQNACKGQGGCKTGDAGCKGKNSCQGKGGCASS